VSSEPTDTEMAWMLWDWCCSKCRAVRPWTAGRNANGDPVVLMIVDSRGCYLCLDCARKPDDVLARALVERYDREVVAEDQELIAALNTPPPRPCNHCGGPRESCGHASVTP